MRRRRAKCSGSSPRATKKTACPRGRIAGEAALADRELCKVAWDRRRAAQEASALRRDPGTSKLKAPPPTPPFTDFRYEKPGTVRKITVKDLPQPYATQSAENGRKVVARPENVWPVAPAGFKVELYATGLENPRTLRTAPNGDIFLTESEPAAFACFAALTADGKARAVGSIRHRTEASVRPGLLSSRAPTRNGYMSATPTKWFAFPITMAI